MPIWRNTTGNFLWGTAGNWDTGAIPTVATDAIFDNLSPNCIVNITTAVCRNLNFNSGTGFVNTIGMDNGITVGNTSTAAPNQSVTLSSGMGISGTSFIATRINGTSTIRSNGRAWPNFIFMNTVGPPLTASSTIVIADNWSVGGLSLGPAISHNLIVSGASTVTINGNFQVNPNTTTSRITAVAGAVTTFVLSGTGTWSNSSAVIPNGFGPNVTINAPGQVVTIADRVYFGGLGIASGVSRFKYIAGTVVHNGTFYILSTTAVVNQYIDLSGSTSPTATNTGTTGVNFSNLNFRSAAFNPNTLNNISNNICVTGNLTFETSSSTKPPITIIGGTIYVGGNLTVNAFLDAGSNSTIVLQGTGTWSENNTLTAASGAFGFRGCSIVINTTGIITLGSYVGMNLSSILTYTAGSFITTNYGFRTFNCSVVGFGSGLIQMTHIVFQLTGGNTLAFLNINDSAPLIVETITFIGQAAGNNQFNFQGTAGFTCGSLSITNSPTIPGATLTMRYLTLPSVEYKITNNLNLIHIPILNSDFVIRNVSGSPSKFTLENGASQDLFYVNGPPSTLEIVDSSGGQTIWTRGGSIANTINWKNWNYPKTQYASFLI